MRLMGDSVNDTFMCFHEHRMRTKRMSVRRDANLNASKQWYVIIHLAFGIPRGLLLWIRRISIDRTYNMQKSRRFNGGVIISVASGVGGHRSSGEIPFIIHIYGFDFPVNWKVSPFYEISTLHKWRTRNESVESEIHSRCDISQIAFRLDLYVLNWPLGKIQTLWFRVISRSHLKLLVDGGRTARQCT